MKQEKQNGIARKQYLKMVQRFYCVLLFELLMHGFVTNLESMEVMMLNTSGFAMTMRSQLMEMEWKL